MLFRLVIAFGVNENHIASDFLTLFTGDRKSGSEVNQALMGMLIFQYAN